MARNKKKERAGKLNKEIRIVLAVMTCLIFACTSIVVYSKYYKTGYNKGMAVASGFYFGSNYMESADDIKGLTMEEIARDYRDSILVSANRNSWNSSTYVFDVELRNYDSQLLYNDIDLDVEYQVHFMLLDEPQGASYNVSYGTQTKNLQWSGGKGTVVSFQGTLPGGTLKADKYALSVSVTDEAAYTPASILMMAYPVGPDYLLNAKCIAGIVKANYEEREFKIESESGFTVCKTLEYETDWKAAVNQESGFVYQLLTTGNYTGAGATETRKTIRLQWKNEMFKINENDEYYKEVKDDISKYYSVSEGGVDWQVMEIEVKPYASLKFVFFRSDGFDEKIGKMSDKTEFETSIKAEIVP